MRLRTANHHRKRIERRRQIDANLVRLRAFVARYGFEGLRQRKRARRGWKKALMP